MCPSNWRLFVMIVIWRHSWQCDTGGVWVAYDMTPSDKSVDDIILTSVTDTVSDMSHMHIMWWPLQWCRYDDCARESLSIRHHIMHFVTFYTAPSTTTCRIIPSRLVACVNGQGDPCRSEIPSTLFVPVLRPQRGKRLQSNTLPSAGPLSHKLIVKIVAMVWRLALLEDRLYDAIDFYR